MRHRRSSFRERGKKNSSWLYIVLAVVLVFVMAKWGVAAFLNLLAGPTNSKNTKQTQTEDRIPPQIPVLSALPEATNSAKIKVSGFTEADVAVSITLNDTEVGTTQADKDGAFSIDVNLKDGQNDIMAKATDKADNTSQSQVKTIVLDTKAPEIKIDSPKDGTEFFGSKNQSVTISGKINKANVELSLNNAFVRVGSDGSLATVFKLAEGDNSLTFIATDNAGNTGQLILKLKLTL